MALTRHAIKEIFREVLKEELVNFIEEQQIENSLDLLPTKKAYKALGYNDPRSLRNAIRDGTFRLNVEFFDARRPGMNKANLRFKISACRDRLNELALENSKHWDDNFTI